MSIELDKHCPDMLHDYAPIIEGNQTVGILCTICGKTVRENMQYSDIVVTDSHEIKNLHTALPTPDIYRGATRRRDPRF